MTTDSTTEIYAILADLTSKHIEVMSAIARGENPAIFPMMRKKLVVQLRLLAPVDPPRAPRTAPGRQRAPKPRRHELTELGRQVLAEHGAAQGVAA